MFQRFRTTKSSRLPWRASQTWAVILLACTAGCTTLSSVGISLTGPHKLLNTANRMQRSAGHPIDLPRELNKEVLGTYVVEPGDVLVVEAADFDSPVRLASSDQTVMPDGTIDIGKYGRIFAAGKTVAEIQAEVQAAIERREQEAPGPILVRLLSWDSKVFYVLGEVNSPGAYPFNGRETVLDALVAAGGLTDRANRHKIIFTRPSAPHDCRVVLPVCYNQIVQLGDTSSNYQVLPGDRIFVTSLTIWDDLFQTISPHSFEKCPRCGTPQNACFASSCDDEHCPVHAGGEKSLGLNAPNASP